VPGCSGEGGTCSIDRMSIIPPFELTTAGAVSAPAALIGVDHLT
jgi:hypothetical protein